MPEVSVIIPCKIGENRVLDAIKSIYDPQITMEILVGIDGKDLVLKSKIDNLQINGLRVYEYVKPIGTTKILNDLMGKSQGKYIARMDADDLSLPNRLKMQLSFMNINPLVDLMCSNAYQKDGTLLIKGESKNIYAKDFLKGNPVIHPTVFLKSEFFKRNGFLYNEKWKRSQDYELWTRFIRNGSIYFSSDPVINYRYDFNLKNFSRQFFFFNVAFTKNFVWCIFNGRSNISNKDLIFAFIKLITTPLTYLKIIIWNLNNAK
jgi:glycosyltransferase involved in cell wall biosynthesis